MLERAGLILLLDEGQRIVFGSDAHSVNVPAVLDFSVRLSDTFSYQAYRIFVCVLGVLFVVATRLVMARTRIGMMLRAGAEDRDMARALGVDVTRIYLGVTAVGIACAVLAGVIAALLASVYPGMGEQILILFVIIVLGGMACSTARSFCASFGLVDLFGKQYFPDYAGFRLRRDDRGAQCAAARPVRRDPARMSDFSSRGSMPALIVLAIGAACVPFLLSGYEIKLATTITIQAGLAVALGFAVGPAGLISRATPPSTGSPPICSPWWRRRLGPPTSCSTYFSRSRVPPPVALVGALAALARPLFHHDDGQLSASSTSTSSSTTPASACAPTVSTSIPGLSCICPASPFLLENARAFLCSWSSWSGRWWCCVGAQALRLRQHPGGGARQRPARARLRLHPTGTGRPSPSRSRGAMAGAMGYLTAAQNGFVAPQMLVRHASAIALVMVLIGGKDTVSGPAPARSCCRWPRRFCSA